MSVLFGKRIRGKEGMLDLDIDICLNHVETGIKQVLSKFKVFYSKIYSF